ncbi:MAG: hypothetical protein NVS3B14_07220 [Ktedonobacteraceae bacterium]
MQCSRCGTPVQQGMAFCPNCGTPYAPIQNARGATPAPSPQYEPTVAAQPPYAGQGYSPAANSAPAQPPYTEYNRQPANPYAPQPPNQYSAQGGYDASNPQPPLAASYGDPYAPLPAPYAPPPGAFAPQNQPPRRRGPNVGLIIGIVVLLIVLIGGSVLAIKAFSHPNGQTGSPTPGVTATTSHTTPTTATKSGPSPSGSPINPTAAGIITNAQTASAIDSNYLPTQLANAFKVGDVVYVTFHLNLTQSGYVQAKVYADNVYVTQSTLTVTVGKYDHGYFQITYNKASSGAFELYWCLQSDCSDATLAAVATFTVS